VGGADAELVTEAHNVPSSPRIHLGLANACEGTEGLVSFHHASCELSDMLNVEHYVAVAEEKQRLLRTSGADVLRGRLVEVPLARYLNHLDVRPVGCELRSEQFRRPAEVDDREIAPQPRGRCDHALQG